MPTLNTIRYFTQADPYHYTVDNRPLEDLEQNDLILSAAIDEINDSTSTYTMSGDWSTMTIPMNLTVDKNKAFAYKIRIWTIEDQSLTATQKSTVAEEVVIGYNENVGSVHTLQVTNTYSVATGGAAQTRTYTGNGNYLNITFSGYTGVNGKVIVRAERFGL